MIDVPVGYIQTDVGVIPEDWEVTQFKEVAKVVDSLHQTPSFSEDGYPMVRVVDIKIGDLNLNNTLRVSESVFIEFTRNYKPKKNDIVLSRVGSYGVSSFVETDEPFCIGQNTVVIEPKIPSRFLYYVLNSPYIRQQIEDGSYGSGYKSLSLKNIKELLVSLPPLTEQTAIATALSDVDALLNQLDKLIAKKRDIKQATMQQLLTGKKRLAGFGDGKGYKQTEIGEIPEDWDCVGLGDIGENLIGLTYSPNDVKAHGTLVLRSSNIQKNKLAFDDNVYVDMDLPKRVMVKQGDILLCVRNGSRQLIGKCALIDKTVEGAAFGAFMSVYRSVNSQFIFYQFQANVIQKQIEEVMGATINQITNKDLSSFKIALPKNKAEQTAIATLLTDMDTEITQLQQRRHKTHALKQGMMQQLLTGKIRLA